MTLSVDFKIRNKGGVYLDDVVPVGDTRASFDTYLAFQPTAVTMKLNSDSGSGILKMNSLLDLPSTGELDIAGERYTYSGKVTKIIRHLLRVSNTKSQKHLDHLNGIQSSTLSSPLNFGFADHTIASIRSALCRAPPENNINAENWCWQRLPTSMRMCTG